MGIFSNRKRHKNDYAREKTIRLVRLIDNSANIVNKTTSPYEFFENYKLLTSLLKELIKAEHAPFLTGDPRQDLKHTIDIYEKSVDSFINRAYEKLLQEISYEKSPQGKQGKLDSFYSSIEAHKGEMSQSNMTKLIVLTEDLEEKFIPVEIIAKNTDVVYAEKCKKDIESNGQIIQLDKCLQSPEWQIMISFGKSTSTNYEKAVFLAKHAPEYREQFDNGNILHQASYSKNAKEFLQFIMLYDLIGNWKSSFVFINGTIMDRQILKGIISCYGEKCRNGNKEYCYGGHGREINPFACRYVGVSRWRNQIWSFYHRKELSFALDKEAIRELIVDASKSKGFCPAFNYDEIIQELKKLPGNATEAQLRKMIYSLGDNNYGGSIF